MSDSSGPSGFSGFLAPLRALADSGLELLALAVLLALRREAQAAGRAFGVQGLPPRLRELASVYGVEALLPG